VKIVKRRAFARAGLLGNPSDGYFGKTISVTVENFSARIVVYEWPELEIILSRQDRCRFNRLEELVEDVKLNGLYGGLRLIKAAIKVFAEFCFQEGHELPGQNFSLRYDTDIPRQVGLAGSSAIITAVFRALMDFYRVQIPNEVLANMVLSVETEEIGITAGLQDRVCQVYEGLVYMDFDREFFELNGFGRYERLDPECLPPLYLAYRRDLSQISGIYHSNLRQRWLNRDPEVLDAMQELGDLTTRGRDALLSGDTETLKQLIDRNFDIRARLVQLDPANVKMINLARSLGLCAKYAGSGGSIVGICETKQEFAALKSAFENLGCEVIRPQTGPS